MTYFKNICGNKKYKNKIDIRQYIYELTQIVKTIQK